MEQLKSTTNEYLNPVRILQNIISYNTVNPPGNETDCLIYIKNILESVGIKTILMGNKKNRQNLVAVLKGRGEKPGLLMYGHIDVVTTELQQWKYPPFDGVIAQGCVWGRGALDMKGALTMMICSIINAKIENFTPAGDIILNIVCDEEVDSIYGAKYMVENHADIYKNVKYAIGEIGGFTMKIGKKRFYPIMISEKQSCSIRTVIHGQGGHGSIPVHNGAMATLGRMLSILDKKCLPVHITPPFEMMIKAFSSNLDFPLNKMFKGLLNNTTANATLKLLGNKAALFDPLLHNTVNSTIVNGGNKINVIPSEIIVDMDGRLLPGLKPENLLEELQNLLGKDYKHEIISFSAGPDKVDMGLFNLLSDIIKDGDKAALPIPFMVSGVTDARYFSKLGIQTYGFTPMLLPEDIDFSKLIHSANEKIPIDALKFGVQAISRLIKRY